MGFALSWVGVRGKPPDTVLADLGYRRTGEQEDVPESPVVCAGLQTGWFVVVMNERIDAFDGTIDLSALSRGAEVVACMVEEHVMVSAFVSWNDGKKVLEAHHNAQVSVRHLDVRGSLSPEMTRIVDDAMRSQRTEDAGEASTDFVFDIPVDLAWHLTGFRHDRDIDDGGDQQFDILEKLGGPKGRGWWSGLFRRGRG